MDFRVFLMVHLFEARIHFSAFKKYLFVFGCCGSLLLWVGFSSRDKWGCSAKLQGESSLRWLLLQGLGSRVLRVLGLSSCGTQACCSSACGIFLSQDRTHVPYDRRWFLTAGPPEKSHFSVFQLESQLMDTTARCGCLLLIMKLLTEQKSPSPHLESLKLFLVFFFF